MINIKIVRTDTLDELNIGEESSWRLKKNGLSGFGSFEKNIDVSENAMISGGYITGEHVSTCDRTISMAYMYPQNNMAERKRIMSLLSGDKLKFYISYGDRHVWSQCKVMRYEFNLNDDETRRMDLMATFIFTNPFWQSVDDFGKNIAEIKPMIAFPFMCAIDHSPVGFTGGVFAFSQVVKVFNGGDIKTALKAVLMARDEVINPSIVINEHVTKLNDNLKKGDEVIMDFVKVPPTITKNGKNIIGKTDRKSELTDMQLNVGENTIKYDADNGSDNLDVSIYYNEQYGAV